MRKIFSWGISSLISCTIFFGIGFGIPEWIYFATDLHAKGLLTTINALALAVGGFLIGAIVGALGWFTVFKPLNERWERGPKE